MVSREKKHCQIIFSYVSPRNKEWEGHTSLSLWKWHTNPPQAKVRFQNNEPRSLEFQYMGLVCGQKMEQSIFCSSLYICKTSLSISGTHFSYRQQLLRYLGTGNDLGEPTGNMAAALLSQKSLVYKCLHMHAGKEMSLLPLLAWLHFPSLRLSPSHFYEHLAFHKSQFPANLNTWSQVLNWNGDSGNLSVIECNIWQVIHSIS